MQLQLETYSAGDSFVHRCDARVKLLLLAVYAATLFLVESWAGMALCAALFVVPLLASGVSLRRLSMLVVPVYVLAALILVVNALSPTGWEKGLFFAVRIVLVVLATLLVSLTSTSTELSDALRRFLNPLRVLHAPVDDIAMTLSIAIRFFPLMADELLRIRNAQWSRGAALEGEGLLKGVKTWTSLLIPLFASLFRRSEVLAEAMDSRCYGASECRTSLNAQAMTAGSAFALAGGLVICFALACML